uniref:Putative ovule protein n=1 Tax=Solanum chacoense TaxID=4108 RepID=A0A0V0H2L9_SOLCH
MRYILVHDFFVFFLFSCTSKCIMRLVGYLLSSVAFDNPLSFPSQITLTHVIFCPSLLLQNVRPKDCLHVHGSKQSY